MSIERHAFKVGDTLEVGPTLCRGLGKLVADEYSGLRGIVACRAYRGGGTPASDAFVGLRVADTDQRIMWVFRDRLRPVQANGFALASYNDRAFGGHP